MEKAKYIILIISVFIYPFFCQSQDKNVSLSERDHELLDYIKKLPNRYKTVDKLAYGLEKPTKNDEEKIKMIFLWIAENIEYDTKSFEKGTSEARQPEETMSSGKAVCDGYTSLFKAACDVLDISCYSIQGYSKGFGYDPKKEFKAIDHSWNAVYLDDEWKLLDVTWGAGYVTLEKGKLKYVKRLQLSYFLTDPAKFLENHLPDNPMWQLMEYPVNLESYSRYASSRDMMKNTPRRYYNFNDTINFFNSLTREEQKIKHAEMAYRFNPVNKKGLAVAYYNHAANLKPDRKDIEKLKKALLYFQKAETLLKSLRRDNETRMLLKNCQQGIKYAEYYLKRENN